MHANAHNFVQIYAYAGTHRLSPAAPVPKENIEEGVLKLVDSRRDDPVPGVRGSLDRPPIARFDD